MAGNESVQILHMMPRFWSGVFYFLVLYLYFVCID